MTCQSFQIINNFKTTEKMLYFREFLNEASVDKVQPKTKDELKDIIYDTIMEQGYRCDLNFIDTSLITDMSYMFVYSKFDGDISKWNTSKVENMCGMFRNSKFNNDISKWNVSNVSDMREMFFKSKFNNDISKWNVSNVKRMEDMFKKSPLEGNEPNWYKI